MIKVTNMNFAVNNKPILKDISFNIKDGEHVAIVGGNGAGKTTIIESILGLNSKYSGKVEFNFDYQKSPLEKIGVQFQDSNYPIGLSTQEIIDFFIKKGNIKDTKFVNDLIDEFKINEFIHKDASKISGGQAQKLNVLLSLMTKPKVLFMDELSTGLDVFSRNIITKIVKNYIDKNQATLLLVTHIASEIETFADRVLVIERGKLINDFSKKEILTKYKSINLFLNSLK